MADYTAPILTDSGRQLLTLALSGQPLVHTRIAIGQGLPDGDPAELTALVDEALSLPLIEATALGDGTMRLAGFLTNQSLAELIIQREIGVYARHPTTGEELLYQYSYAPLRPDILESGDGPTLIEDVIRIITIVSNATDVRPVINSSLVFATVDELREVQNASATREWVQDFVTGDDAGDGSDIDADTVDGHHASEFVFASELLSSLGADAARLAQTPVYPLIQTATLQAAVDVPGANQLRVSETPWLWRGLVPLSVQEATFATVADKTYHLRATLDPATLNVSVTLEDVADAAYNPAALDEADAAFDAGYDDLFLARVVTDGAGDATITTLANGSKLTARQAVEGAAVQGAGTNEAVFGFVFPLAWCRSPSLFDLVMLRRGATNGDDLDFAIREAGQVSGDTLGDLPVSRYGSAFNLGADQIATIRFAINFQS